MNLERTSGDALIPLFIDLPACAYVCVCMQVWEYFSVCVCVHVFVYMRMCLLCVRVYVHLAEPISFTHLLIRWQEVLSLSRV